MLINENALATINRLNRIKNIRENVDEATALGELHIDLLKCVAPLALLATNAILFVNQGGILTSINDVEATLILITRTSVRFVDNPKASTLKNGKHWGNLSNALEALVRNIKENQVKDWKCFFENNFFGGLPPEAQKAKLQRTPDNDNALKLYERLYKNLICYRSSMPRNEEEYLTLREISDQLSQIKFSEDVPEDVGKFFEAVGGGASLELLTGNVLEWLRKHNSLNSYLVRTKYSDDTK